MCLGVFVLLSPLQTNWVIFSEMGQVVLGRGQPLLRPPPKALLIVRGTLRSALLSLTLGLLSSLGCVTLCKQFVSALYNVALNKCRDTGGIRYHGNLDNNQVAPQ